MISIVYCTRTHNEEHINHLKKMSGHPDVEVIEYINEGESLTKFYNRGLKEAKYDVVVFTHDDIIMETKQFAKKLVKLYDKNPEFGILGVAGSKLLDSTGKWWSDPSKMYGKVKHMQDGKTWSSNYSNDLGDNIEEVVVVDGVFFSAHKKRLKNEFDENVKGFHFYDVDFCFNNHINEVKVGVHTLIKLIHKSVGETNDEWESNRVDFITKNSQILPIKLNEEFKNRKLKVLLGCLNFNSLTGSELYFYELAKGLVKNGCEVHIYSNVGGILETKAKKLGIKLYQLNEPPTFKLGDGKWGMETDKGYMVSKVNNLYKMNSDTFDIIHCSHKPITERILQLFPDTPIITTIHSEVISLEEPIINDSIKSYISIRPEITKFLTDKHGIESSKIDLIYNPIDSDRFNTNKTKDEGYTLFVGTIDYLRKETILDLVDTANKTGKKLVIVGKENGVDVKSLINGSEFVTYHPSTLDVEKYTKNCSETASILLGRTTVEGWLCGKNGFIYDIDNTGKIISKKLFTPPDYINEFSYVEVANKIKDKYKTIINDN